MSAPLAHIPLRFALWMNDYKVSNIESVHILGLRFSFEIGFFPSWPIFGTRLTKNNFLLEGRVRKKKRART